MDGQQPHPLGGGKKAKSHSDWRNGPWCDARGMSLRKDALNADDVAEFLDGRGALHQGCAFVIVEPDLDDLFQAGRAQFA